jgi:hypothetical protein
MATKTKISAKHIRRHDYVKVRRPWSPYRPQRQDFMGPNNDTLQALAAIVEEGHTTDSYWELSNQTGVSASTLSKLNRRLSNNATLSTALMVARAYGYDVIVTRRKRTR